MTNNNNDKNSPWVTIPFLARAKAEWEAQQAAESVAAEAFLATLDLSWIERGAKAAVRLSKAQANVTRVENAGLSQSTINKAYREMFAAEDAVKAL